jgi:UDP-3-O-[3-hydroxymyristoyl] glucosamine N-acyltransferase
MIHPSATIDPKAQLDSEVTVGPYALIDGPVLIGSGTEIQGHAVITGSVRIGKRQERSSWHRRRVIIERGRASDRRDVSISRSRWEKRRLGEAASLTPWARFFI